MADIVFGLDTFSLYYFCCFYSLVLLVRAGIGGAVPNAVLCNPVLLCVLEKPSEGSLKRGAQLRAIGPIGLRPVLLLVICVH